MATTLAPVDSREVVRCDRCSLVQFRTTSNLCRRCRTALDDEPEPEPVVVTVPNTTIEVDPLGGQFQVATAIRALRQRSGLSQRQLAIRMRVPRTYVSKIENEKATPTLSSLERLAAALQVTIPELINGGCSREREIRDLVADPFVSELIPYVAKLNGMQWTSILTQMRDLSTRPHRTS